MKEPLWILITQVIVTKSSCEFQARVWRFGAYWKQFGAHANHFQMDPKCFEAKSKLTRKKWTPDRSGPDSVECHPQKTLKKIRKPADRN